MIHVDEYQRSELRHAMQESADESGLRRLEELSDNTVDHTWLWNLSRHRGPILTNAQFIEAVRIRLGAAGSDEPIPCALCGKLFDSAGSHAHCCAIGEATIGHNAVTKELHSVVLRCDPAAEREVAGLIPGTNLRPADILTGCLDGGLTA